MHCYPGRCSSELELVRRRSRWGLLVVPAGLVASCVVEYTRNAPGTRSEETLQREVHAESP